MNSVSAPELKLHLFGGVTLGSTALPGPRAKALILALALSHGRPVSAASLIEDVWGSDAPASASTALHTMVSRIRTSQWHGLITSTDTGYALGIEPLYIDFWAAESLLAEARANLADPTQALELLAMARDLTASEAAAGTANSPVLDDFRQRTARQRNVLARLGAQALTAAGDHGAAAAALGELADASPLDEPLQREYLLALSASGQANKALLAYDLLRRRLRRNLGTDPSPELVALHVRLLKETSDAGTPLSVVSAADARAPEQAGGAQPARRTQSPHSFGLRAAPNQLLGREADISGVEELMGAGRLTTILGVGGLGKTRMALELANRSAARSIVSVMVVELAGIRTPEDMWLALAESAGIREARTIRTLQGTPQIHDLRTRTLQRLADYPALLVMDNCEHLVEQAAAIITEILGSCAVVDVLTTSRAPLNIAGERIYQLAPLATERSTTAALPAAVALFRDRALAARGSVHLDDAVVVRLCRHLDGLPLALELAAAKVRLMSVEEIENRLASRFDLLVNTDRSAPERHRTLTAVIEWSWNLLAPDEQTVMRRLSRFPSGFSLAAARETAGTVATLEGHMLSAAAVEAAVEALINQSLVLAEDDPTTGFVRFRMLETVREFAALRLGDAGEEAAVEQAMTAWAVAFSLRALASNAGPRQLETIRLVTAEQENLLHVLRTAMGAPSDAPDRAGNVYAIFGSLASYWSQRGMHGEVFTLAEQIMAATADYVPVPHTVNAAVFSQSVIGVTTMIFNLRKGAASRARLRRIQRAGLVLEPRMDVMLRLILAAGNEPKTMALLAQLRRDPNDEVAALAMLFSGLWAENTGDPQLAIGFAEGSYVLSKKLQDTWTAGSAADNAAQLHSQSGHPEAALLWAQRAIDHLSMVGADPDVRTATLTLALNHAALGQAEQAQQALESVKTMPPVGEFQSDLLMLETAASAETAFAAGDTNDGLRLYRSLGKPTQSRRNEGPMGLIAASAQICAELQFNPKATTDAGIVRAAKRLRQASIATIRIAPTVVDRPVQGTCALAVGAWHTRSAEPGTQRAAVGLELLVMAEILASRQDEAVLLRHRHEEAAVARHGAEALANAKSSVAGYVKDKAQATELLMKLLTDPSLRGR
ncbi:BTAD domain-containing putative transcriptional regulator [Arthrobacter sp. GMC3]|uniref:AfsR/SARP family transcriptional regulator n=1 Tax=Arthrobacter sp. GMC3 TaxID=2058894 RepID=UPI000CE37082|nr:BTAD domain-containing putative transcriptional regulator [Arthrobacter sp. GMC3]